MSVKCCFTTILRFWIRLHFLITAQPAAAAADEWMEKQNNLAS